VGRRKLIPVSENYFRSGDYHFWFEVWWSADIRGTLPRSAGDDATYTQLTGRRRPFPAGLDRKWKYGGNRVNELAIQDFLFGFNTIYPPNCHGLATRNYFRSWRHRKWRHMTLFNVQEDSYIIKWAGGGYFWSPETTSVREITISGFMACLRLMSGAV